MSDKSQYGTYRGYPIRRTLRVCDGNGYGGCGKPLDGQRCTNGRCHECHSTACTPGGSTSPGHGYGPKATKRRTA